MQNYLEFDFKISPLQPWNEILMAELIEIGLTVYRRNGRDFRIYPERFI
jgi:hypothetical protein